ncbi:MAG TPA: hypothetical protein VM553_00360, partial [Dongiaceae bacterium]|nr:hypothetical protein [Dongiaceae bacterium]
MVKVIFMAALYEDMSKEHVDAIIEHLFKLMSTGGKARAKKKYGKKANDIQHKWEGYHLKSFIEDMAANGRVAETELDELLAEKSGSYLKEIYHSISSKGPSVATVKELFSCLARAVGIDPVRCLLDFLRFCRKRELPVSEWDHWKLDGVVDGIE